MDIDIFRHFGKLFSLRLKHDFYEDQNCRDIIVEPCTDTAKLIQQFGLLFKSFGAEICLGYRNEERLKTILAEEEETLKFSFVLQAQSPYFLNYTELPFKRKGTCFHFSNVEKNEVDEVQLLHKNAQADQENLVAYFPSVFQYTLSEAKEKVVLTLKNEAEEMIWEEEIELHGRQSIAVDLSEEPSGRYQLFEDGELKQTFYSGKTRHRIPLGFVDIYIKPQEVLEEETNNPIFELRFKARATRWKYYIISSQQENLYDKFRIGDEEEQVEFEAAAAEKMKNGKMATTIISKELLPFAEQPQGPLLLEFKKKVGKALTIKKTIPTPSYEYLVPGKDDGIFFAEIFVNI